MPCPQASLFRAANAFRVTWSERVRHRNALTEIAWEDAVQGLGMAMYTVASEKNREMLFIGNAGADPGFFLGGGCTRLLLYFNTNKPQSFFLQNISCIRKPQVISGGGAHPLHPSPRSAPATCFTNSEISACCFTSVSRARPSENRKY